MKNSNVLITGDRGFIASYLCPLLLEEGCKLRGLDTNANAAAVPRCPSTVVDIRDSSAVRREMKGADLVIHLAAAHKDFGIDEHEYFQVNEDGTKNLLECCEQTMVRKFIFFSSVAVYGTKMRSFDEESCPSPENLYGRSKWAAEQAVHEWARRGDDRQALIIRPTVVFGPGNLANMYSLIKQVVSKRFLLVGDGSNTKSVAYVENLASVTVFLMRRMQAGAHTYNYTDQPDMRMLQIVDTIAKNAGVEIPSFRIPVGPALVVGKVLDAIAGATKLTFPVTSMRIKKFCTHTQFNSDKVRALGFKQPIALDEGYRRTVEWVKQQQAAHRSS